MGITSSFGDEDPDKVRKTNQFCGHDMIVIPALSPMLKRTYPTRSLASTCFAAHDTTT